MLFLTSGSLSLINLISSLVYAFVVPYAAIAMTLLFYDLRRRRPVSSRWRCRLRPKRAMTWPRRREMLPVTAQSFTKGVTR